MTDDEVKTKKNELRNNNLSETKTEESTCDINNCGYPDYVTENVSTDITA